MCVSWITKARVSECLSIHLYWHLRMERQIDGSEVDIYGSVKSCSLLCSFDVYAYVWYE